MGKGIDSIILFQPLVSLGILCALWKACTQTLGSLLLFACFVTLPLPELRSQGIQGTGKIKLYGMWEATPDNASVLLDREQLSKISGFTEISAKLLPHLDAVNVGVLPLEKLIDAFPLNDGGGWAGP